MLRARLLVAALLLASPLACDKNAASVQAPSEDAVDRLTRELLDALAQAERARAQSLANQKLALALDERTVVTVGRTLAWLGPVTQLSRTAETPVSGGVERRYRVGFEHGELTLTITVVGDKIEGFEFDEGQWAAVSERALEATARALRVVEFRLVEPLDPAAINYSVALEGLEAQLRQHHVTIDKLVFDGDGNVVYRQREPDDIRFPQAEVGSVGATITGQVSVPGPGSYTLELTISDRIDDKSIVHRVPFTIE